MTHEITLDCCGPIEDIATFAGAFDCIFTIVETIGPAGGNPLVTFYGSEYDVHDLALKYANDVEEYLELFQGEVKETTATFTTCVDRVNQEA